MLVTAYYGCFALIVAVQADAFMKAHGEQTWRRCSLPFSRRLPDILLSVSCSLSFPTIIPASPYPFHLHRPCPLHVSHSSRSLFIHAVPHIPLFLFLTHFTPS